MVREMNDFDYITGEIVDTWSSDESMYMLLKTEFNIVAQTTKDAMSEFMSGEDVDFDELQETRNLYIETAKATFKQTFFSNGEEICLQANMRHLEEFDSKIDRLDDDDIMELMSPFKE